MDRGFTWGGERSLGPTLPLSLASGASLAHPGSRPCSVTGIDLSCFPVDSGAGEKGWWRAGMTSRYECGMEGPFQVGCPQCSLPGSSNCLRPHKVSEAPHLPSS